MKKQEFLCGLEKRLSHLPKQEIEERINFYSEMIDDRMEDGLSEEEAVSAIGSLEEAFAPGEAPKQDKGRNKQKSKSTWEKVLLIVGSPIWLSLLISAVAVVASLYVSLWSVIASLWAVAVALSAGFVGGALGGVASLFGESPVTGVALIAAGLVCGGLSIFMFFGCKLVTGSALSFTKKIALRIKSIFAKKEALQ